MCYTNFISWASLVAQTLKNLHAIWISFFFLVFLSEFLIWWFIMMFFSLPCLFVSYLCSRFRFYGYHEVCMFVLSHSIMLTLWPHALYPARLLCPWGLSRQEYWSGLHALLQGIFPTQWLKPGLPHYRQILYYLSH